MPSAQYNLSPGGNTFIAQDNSFAGLEIGDIKEKNFLPQFKLRRWGKNQDECNISFRLGGVLLDQETNPQISQSGNKISWAGERTRVDFYDTGGLQEETGGYEMDITLLVKPASPIIPVTLNVPKNLDFFYQPPLTADEIKEGCVRPDKVVGSYALYHKTMAGDYSAFGLDNYKAGKFGHIYRPQLIDANGKKVWGELNIDLARQLLTVTMPLDFYNSCAWPVKQAAGLEFGYHVVGGSTGGCANGQLDCNGSYLSGQGVVTSVSIYCSKYGSDTAGRFTLGLYDDVGGNPTNLLGNTEGTTVPSSYQWVDVDASISINDQLCWLSYWYGGLDRFILKFDSGGAASRKTKAGLTYVDGTMPDPHPGYDGTNSGYTFSIYATYKKVGGIPPQLLFSQLQGVF